MKRIIMASILALVLSLTLGLFATQAVAKTVNWRITSYLVKVEAVPVPDVEGHVVGVYERRGVAIYENGETAAYHTRGTFDFIKSQGPFQGYSQMTYKDGSSAIVKYQGEMKMVSGEKFPTFSGKGEYIKGTGKYEGIKGSMSFNAKYITPYTKETKGDVIVDATGTYTLSK